MSHVVQNQPAPQPATVSHEQILVVKRDTLFAACPAWRGLNKEVTQHIITCIQEHKEFLPRHAVEEDPTYKQIIPYVLFRHGEQYFLMQRQETASESRLQNKYSLGIGGHMRQADSEHSSLFAWAQREFHEEVQYTDAMNFRPIGILNDDSNPVGQVHLGIVMLIQGQTDAIKVKSELKSGQLLSVRELIPYAEHMESWSSLLLEYLIKHPRLR